MRLCGGETLFLFGELTFTGVSSVSNMSASSQPESGTWISLVPPNLVIGVSGEPGLVRDCDKRRSFADKFKESLLNEVEDIIGFEGSESSVL